MRVICIVQARMGSYRLPGKTLKKVLGRPLLDYLVERLKRAETIDEIVVATSTEKQNDPIASWCEQQEIICFRGSENDVLERYLEAARILHADVVVRVTGDCPLIDPVILDSVVNYYLAAYPEYDYVSNTVKRSYPRGLDVEVFSMQALEKIAEQAKDEKFREHVTLYMYEHPEEFSIGSIGLEGKESEDRWTVDTSEDLEFITKIIEEIYPKKPNFHMKDVFEVLKSHPEWKKINAQIRQKPIY